MTKPADSPWPQIGVGVVIIRNTSAADRPLRAEGDESGQEILLVKRGRDPGRGCWAFPGGRQEAGETVFQTARREAAEETGTRITPLEIITVVDSITRDDNGALAFHYTLVEVLAAFEEGDAIAGDDADAVAWVPTEAVREWLSSDKAIEVAEHALRLWRQSGSA